MSEKRQMFELFKSEMCHKLKSYGDLKFIEKIVREDWVGIYWKKEWYPECLYTLAMLDYLTKLYGVEPFKSYDFYRKQKMENILWPMDVRLIDKLNPESNIKEKIMKECQASECSREFLKYNIIEGDIRDVK